MTCVDSITLHPIAINTIIGILPHERVAPQLLVVSVTLFFDMTDAALHDRVEYTVDYAAVLETVMEFSTHHQFDLIEAFAVSLADELLLRFLRLKSVSVGLEKPQAFHSAPMVCLKLTRYRVTSI